MKTLRMRKINPIATLFCSRRFENGVEIFEKQTHQIVTVNTHEVLHAAVPSEVRLVIGDAISSATKLFIAKTRSEIGGLEAILKTLTTPVLESK